MIRIGQKNCDAIVRVHVTDDVTGPTGSSMSDKSLKAMIIVGLPSRVLLPL